MSEHQKARIFSWGARNKKKRGRQGKEKKQTAQARKMQLLVSSIDGRLLSFSFPTTHVTLASVKQAFEDREGVPVSELRVSCNGRYLPDEFGFTEEQALGLPPLRVGLRVVGGKGGFGSLLRGGNTKVGQKKVPTLPPIHTLLDCC
jgi:hypothetical protein